MKLPPGWLESGLLRAQAETAQWPAWLRRRHGLPERASFDRAAFMGKCLIVDAREAETYAKGAREFADAAWVRLFVALIEWMHS